ncbi:unnamed protein product [Dibothriocephalus latus]|uniref:Myosin motor domain-containing protein n=1 Tax=Dibothriocephalus latus TaxID=60516 RepID=A0A3P6SVQ9_DIBLA|nr:unnamed protein product [Dibothriocephalus latus]
MIVHFAGTIPYAVDGLVEKNRDRMRPEALAMMCNSGVEGISFMFQRMSQVKRSNQPGAKGRSPTLLDSFHSSLTSLMETMKTRRPWFVRCIKPNPEKKALTFEDTMVMEQLRYIGVLETVKIRSSGFPVRLPYTVFANKIFIDMEPVCVKLKDELLGIIFVFRHLLHFPSKRMLQTMNEDLLWKENEDEVEYTELTAPEMDQLMRPADLAFIMDRKENDGRAIELFKDPEMEVTKTFMVQRRLASDLPGCWTTYKGDSFSVPTIQQVIANSGSSTSAHLDKITRLVYQHSLSLQDEFFMGSYLYQMTLNWPIASELDYATDSEDEDAMFSQARTDLVRQRSTKWRATGHSGLQMKRSKHVISHNTPQDQMRRSHRRLWMHIAGVLTCGRLPKSLMAAVVKHIRLNAPRRSLRFCEDRIVTAPTPVRLYPPSLLEWRVNYTGTNMALFLTYPDGEAQEEVYFANANFAHSLVLCSSSTASSPSNTIELASTPKVLVAYFT